MATLVKQTRTFEEQPQYRVWVAINPPGNMDYYAVASPEDGARFINEEAARQLQDPDIWGNAFGLEELEDGEYHEWYDDDDNDIDELAESLLG